MYKSLIIAASVATASALCPGADGPCSGHGTCGEFDKCSCYRNWQGDDCADRTCPFSTSWNTVEAIDSTKPGGIALWEHGYSECSSKGECDRKAGVCKCFDGYTGVACRRMKCDEDCNNHGTCELISKNNDYAGWDSEKIQKCVCDAGWTGVKCDQKMCKKGDDPITRADFDGSAWTAQASEKQRLTITGCGAADTARNVINGADVAQTDDDSVAITVDVQGDTYTLSYVDWRGETWTTWALSAFDGTAIEIEEALEALPNEAIPSVTVTAITSFSGNGAAVFDITFDSSLNSGNQNALIVGVEGCSDYGCQPKYDGINTANPISNVSPPSVAISEFSKGTTEWEVCSNRGACNADSGDCECFDGFTGEACEIQTIIT